MINLVIITERICSCSISGNTVSTVQQPFSVVGKISTIHVWFRIFRPYGLSCNYSTLSFKVAICK